MLLYKEACGCDIRWENTRCIYAERFGVLECPDVIANNLAEVEFRMQRKLYCHCWLAGQPFLYNLGRYFITGRRVNAGSQQEMLRVAQSNPWADSLLSFPSSWFHFCYFPFPLGLGSFNKCHIFLACPLAQFLSWGVDWQQIRHLSLDAPVVFASAPCRQVD